MSLHLCTFCMISWEPYNHESPYATVTCKHCGRKTYMCGLCQEGHSQHCSMLQNFKKHCGRRHHDILQTKKLIKCGNCKKIVLVPIQNVCAADSMHNHICHWCTNCKCQLFECITCGEVLSNRLALNRHVRHHECDNQLYNMDMDNVTDVAIGTFAIDKVGVP